jgi:hypothetical protein
MLATKAATAMVVATPAALGIQATTAASAELAETGTAATVLDEAAGTIKPQDTKTALGFLVSQGPSLDRTMPKQRQLHFRILQSRY